jgi:hypothetical protein
MISSPRIEASRNPDGTMKTAALFVLIVASALGCTAVADEQDADPLDEPVKQAASMLGQRTDADSLGAAALLTFLRESAGAEQLAARASAAAPQRLDLLWLHAQLCGRVQGCDRKPIDARLHALDPENAVTVLPALGDGLKGPDPAETDRLLGAAATAKRVDIYWNSLIARLAAAVISTQKLTANQSVVATIGAASVTTIPVFGGLSRSCREEELLREGRRAQCQGLVRALLKGDTAIAEMAGASMAPRLWPQDSAAARAAREARRIFDYRASISSDTAARRLTDEAAVRRYLEKMGRYKREQDVIVAEIVEAGRNPTPPANGQPAPRAGAAPAPAAPPAAR